VYKSGVYRLAHFLNQDQLVIPLRTIEKPPSAELRPDQRDDQSLPPYDVLDAILEALIEDAESVAATAARLALDPALVTRVAAMVAGAEYKRRQNPIVLRVSTKGFGSGRKMPVAARMNPA
jgi:NAD+ synthase (glutamine-hydrolysing)